ncbi:G-type lectin S-receptor-like serine/threonine-protein kinase At1g11330 [Amaranthus tricolor]|uniref:G-type lectin S-receptor-like serine/threonine-protein kinase At1g11330 n=1 Tax=Amaranthus tricolor TaxID=29722 RepID=UPI002587D021|nr:G-type lectin S-receptor-like serine/threonine-protein kinase At1g11330 [Amaranthus tricolor]
MDYESLSLPTYAWKLWNENQILSFIDPTGYDLSFQGEISKCIHLGLLCVQEFPEDRPSISEVISMLDVDNISDLPPPKPPGFTQRRVSSTDGFCQNGQHCTKNHLSLTVFSGR